MLAKPTAKITAQKIVKVDFEDDDAAKAANWVLSPISARNIVKKVLAKIFQSMLNPLLDSMMKGDQKGMQV